MPHEGFLVSGMLIPLTMPADVPLWMVGLATAFAVMLGKIFWYGNECCEYCIDRKGFSFLYISTSMSGDKVWMSGLSDKMASNPEAVDGFSGATALVIWLHLCLIKPRCRRSCSIKCCRSEFFK